MLLRAIDLLSIKQMIGNLYKNFLIQLKAAS